MNSYKILYLPILFIIFLLTISISYAELSLFPPPETETETEEELLEYERKDWDKLKDAKEKGIPLEEIIPPSPESVAEEPAPQLRGVVELPFESRLNISGYKLIGLNYGNVIFSAPEEERTFKGIPSGTTDGLEMNQELKIRINGQIGTKTQVNIDYDDTQERIQDISVVYRGDADDIVQEAAFGDVVLSIPSTEFVGYSKSVFGGKINMKYKDIGLMGIGSQTKGIINIKRFSGDAKFEKKDIMDTSYQRRKYYQLSFSTSTNIPIDPGSEIILIDDKDGTNNISGEYLTVKSLDGLTTYYGYFDHLYPGIDYTIDYTKGIIVFKQVLEANCVVAVAYKYNNGMGEFGYSGDKIILKSENESISYELKNYYYLGNNKILRDEIGFVIQVMDLNRTPLDMAKFPYEVDYDAGIIYFHDPTPFDPPYPDIYDNIDPQHHYIIYVEYRHRVKTYMIQPNIVERSERVVIDGKLLQRDKDYIIDYESGFLTFLQEELITPESQIEVTYEYMPFFGQTQQTVIGGRIEYNPAKNFSFGATFLSQGGQTNTIPHVNSTPSNISVGEIDGQIQISPQSYFPLNTTISGEYARSNNNPNVFGKALIDNMEGIKLIDGMPTTRYLWRISSIDGTRGGLNLRNEDIRIKEINPSAYVEEHRREEVLCLDYNLSDMNQEVGIVYPISNIGADFSKKENIEFWIYGDGESTKVKIEFGSFNEDADNDSLLDTEDINYNGILDVGEDTGWEYNFSSEEKVRIGAGNGRIDSEDLDNDGFLDTTPNIIFSHTFEVDWTGWKRFFLPLDILPSERENWNQVKQVRIILKDNIADGSLKFTSLQVVGNKWLPGEIVGGTAENFFNIRAINSEEDPDYVSLKEDPEYKNLYPQVDYTQQYAREQALSLKYNLISGATGYTDSLYTSAFDFSKHKKLRFFIYGDNNKETFFLNIGATAEQCFVYERIVDWNGWKLLTLDLEDKNNDGFPDSMEVKGTPRLENISFIRLGIIGNGTEGEIWVNEIHLSEPEIRIGQAQRLTVNTSLPNWFNLDLNYKNIDRNFETITEAPRKQDNLNYSANLKINRLNWLPVSLSYSQQETVTPSVRETYLSVQDEGKIVNTNKGAQINFSRARLPSLGVSYNNNLSYSNQLQETRNTDNYTANLNYTNPLSFWLLPRNLSAAYGRSEQSRIFDAEKKIQPGFEDRMDMAESYSGNLNFQMFDRLILSPAYSYRKVTQQKKKYTQEEITWPKSGSQNVKFDGTLKIAKWLEPRVNYSFDSNEEYFLDSLDEPTYKNVARSDNLSLNIPFSANKLFEQSNFFKSLTIDSRYQRTQGDAYEYIEPEFYIYDKLSVLQPLTPEKGRRKSYSLRESYNETLQWNPLEFLPKEGFFLPFSTLSTKFNYTQIDDYKDVTQTISESSTRVWPDVEINIRNLEQFIPGDVIQNWSTWIEYENKEVENKNISQSFDNQIKGNMQFNIFRNCNFYTSFSQNNGQEINLLTSLLQKESFNTNFTSQFKFFLGKNWDLTLRYDRSIREEITAEKLTDHSLTDTPSISVIGIFPLGSSFQIPFLKREIQFSNQVRFQGNLNVDLKRSRLYEKNNTNNYKLTTSLTYALSQNLQFSAGINASYYQSIKLPQDNYSAIEGRASVTLVF